MSSLGAPRRILRGKRRNETGTAHSEYSVTPTFSKASGNDPVGQGTKRSAMESPRRNLANDRLKRLRTELKKDVENTNKSGCLPKLPHINKPQELSSNSNLTSASTSTPRSLPTFQQVNKPQELPSKSNIKLASTSTLRSLPTFQQVNKPQELPSKSNIKLATLLSLQSLPTYQQQIQKRQMNPTPPQTKVQTKRRNETTDLNDTPQKLSRFPSATSVEKQHIRSNHNRLQERRRGYSPAKNISPPKGQQLANIPVNFLKESTSLLVKTQPFASGYVNTPQKHQEVNCTSNSFSASVLESARKVAIEPTVSTPKTSNISTSSSDAFHSFSFRVASTPADTPQTPVSSTSICREDLEEMDWTSEGDDVSLQENQSCDVVNINNNRNHRTKVDGSVIIVVDSNIFLSHLNVIKNILESDGQESSRPVIFIPWMVNEELDYLKDDKVANKVKFKSQEAVKYINYALMNKQGRIIGQTLEEFNNQSEAGKSPDNKIIACCLQVAKRHRNTILLSNDVNIRNKAMINNITAYSMDEFLRKMGSTCSVTTKAQKVVNKMIELCSNVICKCAKNAYGDNWNKLNLLQSPPATLQDCIGIFKKYWIAVFQEVVLKQFTQAIDHLSKFLQKNSKLKDDSPFLDDLVRHCVRVCLYLKDVEHCKSLVEETIREINSIKDS